MDIALLEQAIGLLEKANAGLEPELTDSVGARAFLQAYSRVQRLGAFGVAAFSRKVDDATELARLTGTSVGTAKATVVTGKVMSDSPDLSMAMQQGGISLDQATEIAKAEEAAPGAAKELIKAAETESFQVLREKSRTVVLEAEQKRGLAERQREARWARPHVDDLGMTNIHLRLQPHVGMPLMNRAETEARRLYKAAKKNGNQEPFERHLADAYAKMLGQGGQPSTTRAEVVFLVSHEIARRGWDEVRAGEVCKIPGRGPVDPKAVKEIADRAFLNAVVSDGKDLRHFKRFGKHVSRELEIALELGDPPEFDGAKCVDCGTRFRLERDHVEPRNLRGPTSKPNLRWRCDPCHELKTAEDRRTGKLTPGPPDSAPDPRLDREQKPWKRGPPGGPEP